MTPTKEQIEKEAFIAAEELWDKHSEHIDDDIHSLERVAGTVIMFKHDFIKAVQEYASQSKQSGGWVKAEDVSRLCRQAFVDADTIYKGAKLEDWWPLFKLQNNL